MIKYMVLILWNGCSVNVRKQGKMYHITWVTKGGINSCNILPISRAGKIMSYTTVINWEESGRISSLYFSSLRWMFNKLHRPILDNCTALSHIYKIFNVNLACIPIKRCDSFLCYIQIKKHTNSLSLTHYKNGKSMC